MVDVIFDDHSKLWVVLLCPPDGVAPFPIWASTTPDRALSSVTAAQFLGDRYSPDQLRLCFYRSEVVELMALLRGRGDGEIFVSGECGRIVPRSDPDGPHGMRLWGVAELPPPAKMRRL